MDKTLHVYADEIGDIGPYDERSPIYALSLIFVDEATDRNKGVSALKREEKRCLRCGISEGSAISHFDSYFQ